MDQEIKIVLNGTEKNKSEIIYNNIARNLDLTDEHQVAYLMTKVSHLEAETKNKTMLILISILSLLCLTLGVIFIAAGFYWLGGIIVYLTVVLGAIKLYLMGKKMGSVHRSPEYDKIEELRKLLDSKIK